VIRAGGRCYAISEDIGQSFVERKMILTEEGASNRTSTVSERDAAWSEVVNLVDLFFSMDRIPERRL